jgi:hypothetical protein
VTARSLSPKVLIILAAFLVMPMGNTLTKHSLRAAWAASSAGIGVMIIEEAGYVVVKQVLQSGPAAQAGVRAGDIIRKVDGLDTKGRTLDQVVTLILGPAGTPVRLELLRQEGGQHRIHEVVIQRTPLDAWPSGGSNEPGTSWPAQAQSGPNPNDELYLKTVSVMDTQGWGQPVPVKTLLIPVNWQTQGGVTWRQTLCGNDLIAENFRAFSPDGRVVFETLPSYSWQWGYDQVSQATIKMSGCVLAPPRGPQEVLRDIIARYRPGAFVKAVESSPEAARATYEELYQLYGYYYRAQGITLKTDALKVVIEYGQGGSAFEEWITFSWVEATHPVMGSSSPIFHYFIKDIAALRAPKGQLQQHGRLFATILASTRNNPVWITALLQLIANVSTNASIAAGQRAAIWSNAMNQIGEMRVRTWQQSQETLSRTAVSWSRAFRGVDAYVDPTTNQTIELPTGYRNAWSNGMGGYLLSPNPSFNPNMNPVFKKHNWHELQQR